MREGSRVRIDWRDRELEGVVMPSDSGHLVLKLDSGYNVGLDREEADLVEEVVEPEEREREETEEEESGEADISILSTGGTIASRVDYRTGGVKPGYSTSDLLRAVPELEEVAEVKGEAVFRKLSENMEPADWSKLARKVHAEIEEGARGVVVTHGTDTMAYTASALAFMLETPVPVVLTGSQRSADRPSSDNVLNAVSAARMALSDVAEVSVVMHGESSDSHCLAHRGTRVRKSHTSRRDAFRSPNASPLARVDGSVETLVEDYRHRGEAELSLDDGLDEDVSLVKFHPGMKDELLRDILDRSSGLVIEGTGLGHVSTEHVETVFEAVDDGTPVAMTSGCIRGRVCDRVYETGRDLIEAGVIQCEDILPETALVKLMWLLPRTNGMAELREEMGRSLAGELSKRSEHRFF